VASYAYDYLGRRISRTIYGSPNVTIRYAYDGAQIIAEYDGSGTLRRKFVYGPGLDEPICLIDVANGNAAYYYHLDGLGSVVALSNVNNVLVERYAYDVFGRPTIRDPNGVVLAASAFGNPYLFTGRAYDGESGLYYYRARYYDYATGRFLQPDPIGYGDGINWYLYCGNNPVALTDPWGLCRSGGGYNYWSAFSEVSGLMSGYGRDVVRHTVQALLNGAQAVQDTVIGLWNLALSDSPNDWLYASSPQRARGLVDPQSTLSYEAEKIAWTFGLGYALKAGSSAAESGIAKGASKIDRNAFRAEREAFWKAEAMNNPGKYSADDLAKMQKGRAPTGADGYPVELHHVDGTPEGGVTPKTRTDHRLGENYRKNHP
jgi:RHS repeat-associated protein